MSEELGSEGTEASLDNVVENAAKSENSVLLDKIEELAAEIGSLKQQNATQFATQLESQKEKEVSLTPDQVSEFQKNPQKLTQWLAQQVSQGKQEIQKEVQKQRYDEKAYQEFPALKTSKEFQEKVVKQMREFISLKEYDRDHPMLMLRAAQIVGGQMNVKRSTESSSGASTGEPTTMRVQQQTKVKIADDDPRVKFLKLFNMKDPKKIEEFKKRLGPHVKSQRKQARSLLNDGE